MFKGQLLELVSEAGSFDEIIKQLRLPNFAVSIRLKMQLKQLYKKYYGQFKNSEEIP